MYCVYTGNFAGYSSSLSCCVCARARAWDLNVNTCSVWDYFTSWTDCKHLQSCHQSILWCPQQQSQFALAISEQFVGWCVTHYLRSSPIGNICRESCPVNVVVRTTHNWNPLKINSKGHSYQSHHAGRRRIHFAVFGHPPSCRKMCPHALLP